MAIGTVRQFGHLFEGEGGDRIPAFVKHEGGNAHQTQLACDLSGMVDVFLETIADEHKGIDLLLLVFINGVSQHLADLGFAGKAEDRGHLPQQRLFIGGPPADLEFPESPVIGELDFQPAEGRRFLKHLALNTRRHVPGGFAAGGGVHGEEQPSALPGFLLTGVSRIFSRNASTLAWDVFLPGILALPFAMGLSYPDFRTR